MSTPCRVTVGLKSGDVQHFEMNNEPNEHYIVSHLMPGFVTISHMLAITHIAAEQVVFVECVQVEPSP